MNSVWLKIKVWTKVVLFAVVFLYALLFIAKNSERPVTPWFWFGREPQTSVLILGLCAFLLGVLSTVLLRTTFKTVRQIRELQARSRADKLQREVDEMKTKAAMLRTRELPTAPLVLYAVGAVPVSLRAFVPEAVLDLGLVTLALGVAWLAIWLFDRSSRIATWTTGTASAYREVNA